MEEEKKVVEKTEVKVKKASKQDGAKYVIFGALIIFGLLIVLFSVIFVLEKGGTRSTVGGENEKEVFELVVTQDEKNTIDIVQNSEKSVVSIAVSQVAFSQGEGVSNIDNNIGTGFIVDESGIVITNQHVVSDEDADYRVINNNGEAFEITQILRDTSSDIALIRIDVAGKEIKALELGDSDKLLVGQSVIAIGTPLGEYAGSVTTGIVSGLNRSLSAGTGWFGSTSKTYEGVIQTDAAINPGNSGGPLIDSQGRVIGVNFATSSNADNISFALPINKVKNRLEEYRVHGKFIMPYLGVSYQIISSLEAQYYKDVVAGALIVRIDPISPAYEGGIRRGDFITEFGGEKVTSTFGDMIQKHTVGEEVSVKVNRAGEELDLKVTLGEME